MQSAVVDQITFPSLNPSFIHALCHMTLALPHEAAYILCLTSLVQSFDSFGQWTWFRQGTEMCMSIWACFLVLLPPSWGHIPEVHCPQRYSHNRNQWFGDNPAGPSLHLQGCEWEIKPFVLYTTELRSVFLQSIVKNIDDSDKIGTVLSHQNFQICSIVFGASRGKSNGYRRLKM